MRKFKFYSNEIIISNERENYNEIHLLYKKYALMAANEFIDVYNNENKDLDDVVSNAKNQAYNIIFKYANETIEFILAKRIFNIDLEKFINNYYLRYFGTYEDAFEVVENMYLEIVATKEQQEQYRRARKENRGRWQGGGFGISGAMKGAMKAGALNLGTGILHSAVNSVGNLASSISASNKKSKVFKNPDTLNRLVRGIYSEIISMEFALIDILNEYTGERFDYVDNDDREEVKAILNNLINRDISDFDKIELIKKSIYLNPYEENIYIYIIREFGDSNKEIEKIADFFGVDILEEKNEIISDLYNKLDLSSEQSTFKAKEQLINLCDFLGVNLNNDFIDKIEFLIQEYDLKARTVNNIVFDSRSEAMEARNEKEKIENIISNMDLENEESLKDARREIINFKTCIKNSYIKDIDDKLKEIDINIRTVDETLYKTREEAQCIRKEKEDIQSILNNIDYDDINSIKTGIENLRDGNFKVELSKKNIEKLEYSIKELKKKNRTIKGIEYNTEEEAEIARNEAFKIEKKLAEYDNNKRELLKSKKAILDMEFKSNIWKEYVKEIDNIIENIKRKNNRRIKTIIGIIIVCLIGTGISFKILNDKKEAKLQAAKMKEENEKLQEKQLLEKQNEAKKDNENSDNNEASSNSESKAVVSDATKDEKNLVVDQVMASSMLNDNTGTDYTPGNIVDGKNNTIWAEGVDGSGVDENIILRFDKDKIVKKIFIINGSAKSEKLYYANNRVREVRLDFSNGESKIVNLNDGILGEQEIDLGEGIKTSYIKVTILSVYSGEKYDDTCISEIRIVGND